MAIHLSILDNADRDTLAYWQQRYDFRWIANYAAFEPVALRWWDDASYAAYQCDDGPDDYESFMSAWREALDVEAVRRLLACEPPMPVFVPTAPVVEIDSDAIPF